MAKSRSKRRKTRSLSINQSSQTKFVPKGTLVEKVRRSEHPNDILSDITSSVAGLGLSQKRTKANIGSQPATTTVKRYARDHHPSFEEVDYIYQCLAEKKLSEAAVLIDALDRKFRLSPMPKLAQAHLLIAKERPHDAWDVLQKCEGQEHVAPAVSQMTLELALMLGKPYPERAARELLAHFPQAPEAGYLKYLSEKNRGNFAAASYSAVMWGDSVSENPSFLLDVARLPSEHALPDIRHDLHKPSDDEQLDIARKFAAADIAFFEDCESSVDLYALANGTAQKKTTSDVAMTVRRSMTLWCSSGLSDEWFFSQCLEPREKTPEVFIAGAGRSGSSFTASLLATHPHVFRDQGCHEILNLLAEDVGNDLSSIDKFMNNMREEDRQTLRMTYQSRRFSNSAPGLRITEGRHLLCWLPLISVLFPDVPIIFPVRHAPFAATESYMRWSPDADRRSFDPFDVGADLAAEDALVAYYMSVLPNPKIIVAYDDLMTDPEKERDRLLSYLGLSPVEERLPKSNDIIHPCDTLPAAAGIFRHADLKPLMSHILGDLMEGYLSVTPPEVPEHHSDRLNLCFENSRVSQTKRWLPLGRLFGSQQRAGIV